MAIYRIYPSKDTTLFSNFQYANAGGDEILEIGRYLYNGDSHLSRILIKFDTQDIQEAINSYIGNAEYSASLHISHAVSIERPFSASIEVYPIYSAWKEGIGKIDDIPKIEIGASWTYSESDVPLTWGLESGSSLPTGVTGSYERDLIGGGNWYYSYEGSPIVSSQSLLNGERSYDLDFDVTLTTQLYEAEILQNEGYILKLDENTEKGERGNIHLKYFGKNTNTIYTPYLQLGWDDSIYSSSLPVLDTQNVNFALKTDNVFPSSGKKRVRFSSKPKHPVRTFTTSSAYVKNYILPENSLWGIMDNFTQEMVINFHEDYTRISADGKGNYFDLYLESLPGERFYKLLVKTQLDGSDTVIDGGMLFKIATYGF